MGELRIMDEKEGDFKIVWDPESEDEIAMAEESFNKAKKKGMTMFKLSAGGKKGEELKKFDPEAARIVAVPQVVGG